MLAQSKYAPGHYPPANVAFPRLGGAKVTRYFKKLDDLSSKVQGPLAPMIQRKTALDGPPHGTGRSHYADGTGVA